MPVIVTYDVPNRHVDLKQLLFNMGYSDTIAHFQDGIYKDIHLPNTTLYHTTKTAAQARGDLQSCTTQLQIRLERCVATPWGPSWAAIYGEPFGS